MKNIYNIIGTIGQWLSFFTSCVGIYFLFIYNYDIGTILIVSGSLIWGLSTKIKYYKSKYLRKKEIEELKQKRREQNEPII